MQRPCDGDSNDTPGQSWCLIVESASCVQPAGQNWDYCTPNSAGGRAFGVVATATCSDNSAAGTCSDNGCVWNSVNTECEDKGNCVERPGLAHYRLRSEEERMEEANGASRASVGVAALLALMCAVMDRLR